MSLSAQTQTDLTGSALSLFAEWTTVLTLIFGGCCSNAIKLEELTRAHKDAGSLITFAQFVSISLHGLPTFLTTSRWHGLPVPHLRKRKIPLSPYLVQVVLFYVISLLNNMAFSYKVPMPIHIIFRSGGLVVSMVMGWAIARKRYHPTQVASVLLVTAGVVLTTLSASSAKSSHSATPKHAAPPQDSRYLTGIALLSLALVLSGALGLVQDWTYGRYTRASTKPAGKTSTSAADDAIKPWQESMFYLHFLALPMFLFVRHDLAAQARALRASPPLSFSLPLPDSLTLHPPFGLGKPLGSVALPSGYVSLALTTLTSLVCIAGVNQLTARVSSLTVTLVLVVRKAVSMVISVVLLQSGGEIDALMMWAGAALVFFGTMGYAAGSRKKTKSPSAEGEKVKKE